MILNHPLLSAAAITGAIVIGLANSCDNPSHEVYVAKQTRDARIKQTEDDNRDLRAVLKTCQESKPLLLAHPAPEEHASDEKLANCYGEQDKSNTARDTCLADLLKCREENK